MIKTDKNFKLSKYSKRRIATIVDPHQRGAYKRMLIEAEAAERKVKLAKVSKNQGED